MSAFTDLARAITAKAKEVRASEHLATVLRQDSEGVYWVSIPGGADESPISTAMVNAMPGDTVRVSIANGRSVMTGNVTSPSATTSQVGKVAQVANKAMTTAYSESARIDNLEATALTAQSALIGELVAEAAKIENLTAEQIAAIAAYIGTLVANDVTAANIVSDHGRFGSVEANAAKVANLTAEELSAAAGYIEDLVAESLFASDIIADHAAISDLDVDSLDAKYLKANFSNIDGAHIDSADIKDLFAHSGWFDEVTITGDETITGQLKSVLVDGDSARFRNIYADALKILGEDGLYHALNFMGYDQSKEYYPVTPESDDDPSEKGWYERSGSPGSYVYSETEDTSVVSGKTYYEERYASAGTRALFDEYGESLDNGLHGSHIIAESITATEIDVSTLVTAMLLTQVIQVGASGGIHVEMNGNRFSFLAGDAHLDPNWSNPMEPQDGEVAFIAVDPTSNNSMFYINNAVIVTDLRFGGGNWKWYSRSNNNMALKWMGGQV